jgi:SAM-dependent methyltransferase
MSDGAFWDSRYAGADCAYGEAPNAFLKSMAGRLRVGQDAFVPGDGEGRNGALLASLGLHVDTLDLSPAGVAKAKALAEKWDLSLHPAVGDLLTHEWPVAAYDLVALIYLHLLAPERRFVHARALAALKPGGLIVLEAFTPAHLLRQAEGTRGGPRDAALLYSAADLREDFGAAEIELLQEAEVDLSEGALHEGRSAVVRMVARKSGG